MEFVSNLISWCITEMQLHITNFVIIRHCLEIFPSLRILRGQYLLRELKLSWSTRLPAMLTTWCLTFILSPFCL